MKADYEVGIVGAGFAGLAAALRLKKSGKTSFVVFERAAEPGGTWRDNVYPGCACDVASPLYSLRQALNSGWSRLYAGQPEILAYMNDVVQKNDLRKHIRFQTDIVTAVFQKDIGGWVLTDRSGNSYSVHLLVLGTGPLNRPHIPNFAGLATFKGNYFHSSQWDSSFDFTGKKVAVIGTGASAIQIIPALAPIVEHLTVFQRTPAWVTPRNDRALTEAQHRRWKKFPTLLWLKREAIYWFSEFLGLGFVGFEPINRIMRQVALGRLKRQVKDPETRQKLTPTYKIGCKRILRSDDYYKTFNRQNVTLVTDAIDQFTEEGIVANGRLHPLDAVVFGTGFIAADIHLYLQVIGPGGDNLIDRWKVTGAEAYRGTTVAGFPSLCLLLGPNTGLGHNSVVHMMESQLNYVMGYLQHLEQMPEGAYLDVKEDVQRRYNTDLQRKFKGTVWSSGCQSWYLNAAGKNTTLYPRLSARFRRQTKRFDPAVYRQVQQTVPENTNVQIQ